MYCDTNFEWFLQQGFSATFLERFWGKVMKCESCWIWTACKTRLGYGKFSYGPPNSWMGAHRASWMIHFGPIPKGLGVLHNCPGGDNPSCVNPVHLWLGTSEDNLADMKQKGRSNFGERHWNHKLTKDQVDWVRAAYQNGEVLQRELGDLFGVSNRTISKIVNGETWE